MKIRSIPFVLISQLIVILLLAVAMKQYYSAANVNDLRWILGPTAAIVELITRERFVFESFAGYLNEDKSYLIAASCSGVNFLITAFLLLTLRRLWRDGTPGMKWSLIPWAALAAYLTTIVANAVRISIALSLRGYDKEFIGLGPEQLHRFEGIFIYFGFLLLLFFVSEMSCFDKSSSRQGASTPMLRRCLLPVIIYYATTLGIPVVNSAYRGVQPTAEFAEHALFVLITPVLLFALLLIFHWFKPGEVGIELSRGRRPVR